MLNRATIIGRMGQDPELRYAPNGDAICNFSLATTEKWKDKQTGEVKEATEWHRISAWGRLAEIVGEYLRKGSLVYVEGKIQTRKYQDKDGAEKSSTEIRMTEMKLLGGRQEGAQAPAQGQQQPRQGFARAPAAPRAPAGGGGFSDMDDGEIPF